MVVVTGPRPHRTKPRTVGSAFTTKCFLDRGVDEYSFNLQILCGSAYDRDVAGRPDLGVDVTPALGHDHRCRDLLALLARVLARRHGSEPDVGVEPDLMARVAAEHRPTASLRHVADQQAAPAEA